MTIVHTVKALCDHDDCSESVALSRQSTQIFIDLTKLGWALKTTDEGIETFCPKHGSEAL